MAELTSREKAIMLQAIKFISASVYSLDEKDTFACARVIVRLMEFETEEIKAGRKVSHGDYGKDTLMAILRQEIEYVDSSRS